MGQTLDSYPFSCSQCDYDAHARSGKAYALFVRLHNKKCKKTGRTVASPLLKQVIREREEFAFANCQKVQFIGEQGMNEAEKHRLREDLMENQAEFMKGGIIKGCKVAGAIGVCDVL
jgi:hypothetical protein